MTLKDKLAQDLKESMQAGTADRTGVIRLLMSSLTNDRIKLGHELSDEEAQKVLQREAKQRRDSIEAYTKAGRSELAAVEEAELLIIENYLPKQLSEAEIARAVDAVIADLGPGASIGPVVGAVLKRVGATADGASVSRIVRERLDK